MSNASRPLPLLLILLLLVPGATALGVHAAPAHSSRGWVDPTHAEGNATVTLDGETLAQVPLPTPPVRESKTPHPVRAEVATAPRRAEAGDTARADAGGGRNITTDASAWSQFAVDTATPGAAEPTGRAPAVGFTLMADANEAVETHPAPAKRLVAPAVGAATDAARHAAAPPPSLARDAPPWQDLHPRLDVEAAPDAAAPAPRAAPGEPDARDAPRADAAAADPPTPVRLARAAALATGLAALLLAPWLLHHRVRSRDLLESSTRGRIHTLLREQPGLGAAQAARTLGLDPTTVRYHLRRLEKDGLTASIGPARRARHFAAGTVPGAQRAELAATEASRRILRAVRDTPGATKSRLAAHLALARPTISWHLDRLAERGLVAFERVGREVRVRAT